MLERFAPAVQELIRVAFFFAAGVVLMMAMLWLR